VADNSGTGALGVFVGALLVIGSKGPSITIGSGK
jgi:hypothetical protein